jgi:hypothetical protein
MRDAEAVAPDTCQHCDAAEAADGAQNAHDYGLVIDPATDAMQPGRLLRASHEARSGQKRRDAARAALGAHDGPFAQSSHHQGERMSRLPSRVVSICYPPLVNN